MLFKEKLRNLLAEKGMTQTTFSEKVGMNKTHANKFFLGRKPNMDFIQRIVKVFPDVDLNWLLIDGNTSKRVNNLVNEPQENYSSPEKVITEIEQKIEELKEIMAQK